MSARVPRVNFSAIALVILLAVLAIGLMKVLNLRFSTGEMYPRYSSLREDQLGTKAFYESLGAVYGVGSERQYLAPQGAQDLRGTALMYLGVTMPLEEMRALNVDLRNGGRIVLTLSNYKPIFDDIAFAATTPTNVTVTVTTNGVSAVTNATGSVTNALVISSNVVTDAAGQGLAWIYTQFHDTLDVDVDTLDGVQGKRAAERSSTAAASLPETLTSYAEFGFSRVGKGWSVIYKVDDVPVMLERKVGKGSMVISTVTYPFSNHALQYDRASDFLTWAVGDAEHVRFDETHFGIATAQGVGTLARKYRLQWLGLGLVLLGGLFVWKSSARVIPAYTYSSWSLAEAKKTGRDSLSGLENLLAHHVSRQKMIRTLLTVFKKSAGASTRLSRELVSDINELVR